MKKTKKIDVLIDALSRLNASLVRISNGRWLAKSLAGKEL